MDLFSELRRRNVFRVAIGYVVSGWLLAQVADLVLDAIGAPEWVMQTILLVLALGFPVVVFFSWAYEVTPEGIKRESEVDRSQSITHITGRKLDRAILAVLVLALGYFAVDKFVLSTEREATPASVAAWPAEPAVTTPGADPQQEATDSATIAVLPFVNMSNDPDQEYFSDGLSEELLNALVRVDGLEVASRTSAFAFKGRSLSLPQIAAELKVAYILEGSVRRAGEQLRITAQLIDTRSDRHLWSETYDRTLADVFAIQSEIATAITTALQTTLGLEEVTPISVPVATENMSAYDLYLKGRDAFTYRKSTQDVRDSIRDLEEALAMDPQYIDAMEALAASYAAAPWWGLTEYDVRTYERMALDLTDRVLARDPRRSMAWAIRGFLLSWTYEPEALFADAVAAYQRALELNPRNVHALHWRGQLSTHLGYLDAARSDQEHCLEIEPLFWNCLSYLTGVLMRQQEFERAIGLLQQYLELRGYVNPTHVWAAWLAGERMTAWALAPRVEGWEELPLDELFYALEHPGRQSSDRLQNLISWAVDRNEDVFAYPEILVLAGAYEQITGYFTEEGWYWYPNLREFRQSDRFKWLMRNSGVLTVWRERGTPPQCRLLAGEDFECD